MGRGYLRLVPEFLRPVVQGPLDALRRSATRLGWLLGVKLHPRRIARTFAFLRASEEIHRGPKVGDARIRVAVDAEALWDNMTGIGWYLYKVLCELEDRADLELWLYGPPSYGHDLEPKVTMPEGRAIRLVRCPIPEDQSLPVALAFRLLRRREARMVAGSGCQVVWLPNFLEPKRFSRLLAPRVTTVHDLACVLYPETLREERRLELEQRLRSTIADSSKIVTPSLAVRSEIIEQQLAAGDQVVAVLHGPGHLSDEQQSKADRLESVVSTSGALAPLTKAGEFALHVGTLEPRKNVEFLVDVWRSWWRAGSSNFVPLVLCGGSGWKIESLQDKIKVGAAEGWLVRPGYVEDPELARLYRRARFTVSASLYEGFGLPLVESMAAGTAVLCSDIKVYREVTQDAALLVSLDGGRASEKQADARAESPLEQRWVDALEQISSDADRRLLLVKKGRERVAELSWSKAARSAAEVLIDAALQGAIPTCEMPGESR